MSLRPRIPHAFSHGLGHEQPLGGTENHADEGPVFSSLKTYSMNKLMALDRQLRTVASQRVEYMGKQSSEDVVAEGKHNPGTAKRVELSIKSIEMITDARDDSRGDPIVVEWNLVFVRLAVADNHSTGELEIPV